MCGIIGYLGPQEAMPIILDGLKRLEYRGYDSAGMAVIGDHGLAIRRSLGKLIELEKLLRQEPLPGQVGIGHTRWATHGPPSETNAHPHRVGDIAVVHNGIIENYLELKEQLLKAGHRFCFGDRHGDRLPPHRQAPAPGSALSGGGAPDSGDIQGLLRPGHRQRPGAAPAGGGPQGKPPDPGAG